MSPSELVVFVDGQIIDQQCVDGLQHGSRVQVVSAQLPRQQGQSAQDLASIGCSVAQSERLPSAAGQASLRVPGGSLPHAAGTIPTISVLDTGGRATRGGRSNAASCHDSVSGGTFVVVTFEEFAFAEGAKLRAALVGAFGMQLGLDSYAEASAYGWQHWSRISAMDNPTGYLFRVGQTFARRATRPAPEFPAPPVEELPTFEPALLPALAALPEQQRIAVVLVHGYGWSMADVARLQGVTHSTVRTHLGRALSRLQAALEVPEHAE